MPCPFNFRDHTMNIHGTLYIVATPIGNKEDITRHALRILAEVNFIAAEDTRHSKPLLQHYAITTPLISLHEFNQAQRVPIILERLQKGEHAALISDAGTPLISDPGYLLVRAARDANIRVVPIPGACAAITALCAAGLPSERFAFEGFLSAQRGERQRQLQALAMESRTLIFYEAPHRILSFITDIGAILGADREIVLAKELTKTFETFIRGNAEEVLAWLQADDKRQQGEFVVLVHGAIAQKESGDVSTEAKRVLQILLEQLPSKQAVELTAQITGEKKNSLKKLCF